MSYEDNSFCWHHDQFYLKKIRVYTFKNNGWVNEYRKDADKKHKNDDIIKSDTYKYVTVKIVSVE